jgi:hypothetical protein
MRLRIAALTLSCLAFAWGLYGGLFAAGNPNATQIGGGITAAINVSFHASPLKQLYLAVKEVDLKRVPVLLSVVQFFQSAVWIIAGAFMEDWFILGVNANGFFFSIVQLSVIAFILFKRWRQKKAGGAGKATATVAPEATETAAADSASDSASAEQSSSSAVPVVKVVPASEEAVAEKEGAAAEPLPVAV